ncbi:MAG: methyl-accepting chemotaxis protein [Pseudomonadota bacterium]
MNAQVGVATTAASAASGKFGSWEGRQALYDPDRKLDQLMAGLLEVLQDDFERIYRDQIEVMRSNPATTHIMTPESIEANMANGMGHFTNRFSVPATGQWMKYTVFFGRLMVTNNVPTSHAVAILSYSYEQCLATAVERLEGQRLIDAVKAMHLMLSMETDVMVDAMYQALNERHAAELAQRAEVFEEKVLKSVSELTEMAHSLRKSSDQASTSSKQLQSGTASVATASHQSATAMREAESTIQFLCNAVDEVNETVREASGAAAEASTKATDSAVSAQQLTEPRAKIGSVVKFIRDIADSTQILALNATIEAARAGESGAGFAVVADEVKQLAMQTTKATEEIEGQVQEITEATESTVRGAHELTGFVKTIATGTEGVRKEVENQLDLIQSITDAISETFSSAEGVSKEIGDINGIADQVAENFGAVDSQFKTVDDLLSQLQRDVREYRESFGNLEDAAGN